MKTTPTLLLFLVSVFILGCRSLPYQTYMGEQKNWPISSGSFVRHNHGVQIYSPFQQDGWPGNPYFILGQIHLTGEKPADLVNILAKAVKEHRGDAGIICDQQLVNAGNRYIPGQIFIFGNRQNNSMFGFSTPGRVETISRFVAVGYVIGFQNSLQTELNNLHEMIEWAKDHPGGGVYGGTNYSPEQINAAQRQLLTKFAGWIEWCNQHPNGGTFTNSNGQIVEVLPKRVSPVLKELKKERDKLESNLKKTSSK